ncbi:MAG: [Bacteroidales bacterium]|nr:[FeFe] hydrogenase H-cluster maturation GTPase HydF [Bacteroidales bacterium]
MGIDSKPRIGIFGCRNRGKSTLLNLLTGQSVSIVSEVPGTTTDPVSKSMELIGVGPVVWVDTAGIDDDDSSLGQQRVAKTMRVLSEVDLALILVSCNSFSSAEEALVSKCELSGTPYILIYSMADAYPPRDEFLSSLSRYCRFSEVDVVSIHDARSLSVLLQHVCESLPETAYRQQGLLDNVVKKGDIVVLVCPIDDAAPAGRLILPQVQTIRAALDCGATAIVCKPEELSATLGRLTSPPSFVITDSQAFAEVSAVVPQNVPLTSFSILLSLAKGPFDLYIGGVAAIDTLRNGDNVLILESCTHNITCSDIGRVKLPKMLSDYTGRHLHFETVSGMSQLPRTITDFSLVIQCGGCVATPRQLHSRLAPAIAANIPITNYGIALAYMQGILPRTTQIWTKTI